MGDTYNQNHSGSGHNIGRVDNLHVGKHQFEMSDAQMKFTADELMPPRPVAVIPVGSQRSQNDAAKLAAYLRSRGFTVSEPGGTMMLLPPLEQAIEFRPDGIYVDSSK